MTAAVRPATRADSAAIFALTYELAGFESLTHVFTATEAGLRDALFAHSPRSTRWWRKTAGRAPERLAGAASASDAGANAASN
ncbi:hypothetical protein [Paraburkholderia xenovorans]|uniref:hypothetical protein n=1 Tax=Paraburkholderia xenovorans TaxID=36873 RepID=UPI0038B6B387